MASSSPTKWDGMSYVVANSPPKNLKAMYDFLPTDEPARSNGVSPKHTPKRVTLEAGLNSGMGGQMMQAHALGVYNLVPDAKTKEDEDGRRPPLWKHVTADLCLVGCSSVGEDEEGEPLSGFIVAKFSTFGRREGFDQRCLQVVASALPFSRGLVWSMWNGRAWEDQPSIKCRPSYAGSGIAEVMASDDNSWNVNTPNSPTRRPDRPKVERITQKKEVPKL